MRRFVRAAATCFMALCAAQYGLAQESASAVFAGGCFWCLEAEFERLPGVLGVETGYAGGTSPDPTFAAVTEQRTDHRTAVRILYDPRRVSYRQLLPTFWNGVDPYDGGGQFCERGASHAAAIYVDGPEQRRAAEETRRQVEGALKIAPEVDVLPHTSFRQAEPIYQDYWRRFPARLDFYVRACGRDVRLAEVRTDLERLVFGPGLN